jgi:radical SAM superfamily enzyme YgiQ (UPF0313 family)
LAVATAKAFLEEAGFRTDAVDLAVEPLPRVDTRSADAGPVLVAVSVPMHTALRLGVRAADRLRRLHPRAHLCFFGLYAALNQAFLLEHGICDSVVAGELEPTLVALARALVAGRPPTEVDGVGLPDRPVVPTLERLRFPLPSRAGLPGHARYAHLAIGGERRPAAAIEASRGCLHHCRHCPIPPVYGGRFFVVPREVVHADVDRLVDDGVRHLTFADPDFFNGPGHTVELTREIHRRHPEVTFDITTKIEHLLRHRQHLRELAHNGCLFVVSAVESLNDEVLRHLDKGHTRAQVFEAQRLVVEAGLTLRPSLVPFTPWETRASYREILDWIARERLVGSIDPVQLSIRLLVPPGSLLERSEAMRPHLRGLDAAGFTHRWVHPDPQMDALQQEVARIVEHAALESEDDGVTLIRIRRATDGSAERSPEPSSFLPARAHAAPPRLTEPWFC